MRPYFHTMIYSCLACCLASPVCCLAWGPYAHYAAGSPVGLGSRVNVPDYWGASWELHAWPPSGEIKALFASTHGCMRMGVTSGVPETPTEYGFGEAIAEFDMEVLIGKMSPQTKSQQNCSIMLDTVKDFYCHNVLDLQGHFDLFPGASEALRQGDPAAGAILWEYHSLLEEYVDYVLVDTSGGSSGTINANGGAIQVSMGSTAHAGLMSLAQKCFRKNRFTIDLKPAVSGQLEPGPLQSATSITNMITSQANELTPKIFTSTRFTQLRLALIAYYGGPQNAYELDDLVDNIVEDYYATYVPAAQDAADAVPDSICTSP